MLAEESGRDVTEAARALYRCLSFLRVGELLNRTRQIGVTDYYDRLAMEGALEALEEAAGGLALDVLAAGDAAAGDLAQWVGGHAPAVARAKARGRN